MIKLKNIMKVITSILKGNYLEIDIVCWVGRGIFKIDIPSSGHSQYDRFKQNLKSTNYIPQILETLSDNNE